jgi:GNAT superfamily N-acetyltransferase
MNLRFEKVQVNQANILLQIVRNTFISTYQHLNDPDQFKAYLDENLVLNRIENSLSQCQSHYYFGRIEDEIVSYFHVLEFPIQTDINTPNSLEIARFYVLDAYKAKGIGKQMMTFVKSLASTLNKQEIWLGVWERNPNAIAFYEKMDFSISGRHTFMIGEDQQTDYIMNFQR